MAVFKSSLDFCEPQVNKCSNGPSPTVIVRAGTGFLAKPFTSRLKAAFRYPLTTMQFSLFFFGRIDSAVENQRKTGVGKGSVFTCFNAPYEPCSSGPDCSLVPGKGFAWATSVYNCHSGTWQLGHTGGQRSLSLAAAYSQQECGPTAVLKRECVCR